MRVLGLGEVSSLQRDTIKIETQCQTEKSLESQTVEAEVEETKKNEIVQKKRQQKLSKKLCLSAVSSLTVARLHRSACLAFYARPKRL